MTRPLIGIVPLYDDDKESYWMLPGYMKGIEEAGGIPVMLPLTTHIEVIEQLAHTFDGFLMTGGHDVDPQLYGENPQEFCGNICKERDHMEEILLNKALQFDKPVLGICRGIQLVNVLLGGTLYQDIPSQFETDTPINHAQKPPYDIPIHRINIEKGTPFYNILKSESIMVNSYHHQGIKKLSPQLRCAAKAVDDLIEAVYMPEKSFVVAVQWHPEFCY
ncbi:gamma-glutamyl-gamma-aminobutyrate hydrolase family protein [Desulfitobacterium sp. Sab5]|uniref:gamma-glutamyl-gamma-aminobutyrate hydrolase family protein n=1 Tax=Desulfitobacterium nosdiversum TaxID=3375356 RepID=UPI003CF31D1C